MAATMPIEHIKLSQQAKEQLARLKRVTGLQHWNELCRWALCVSLADPTPPSAVRIPADSSIEMDWKTFGGQFADLYLGLLRERCHQDGLDVTDEVEASQLRLHLHRGIGQLAADSRLHSIAEPSSKGCGTFDCVNGPMTPVAISRHRTALARKNMSRPVRLALEDGIISQSVTVFDYGCGRGSDVDRLRGLGVAAKGWDPVFLPASRRSPADIVNLGYVVNVIEDAAERANVLREAWRLSRRVLVVSARTSGDDDMGGDRKRYGDGVVTRLGTFQRFFEQHELREWIDGTLGQQSVAAAPGVFYVFRDDAQRESFSASRYRRAIARPRQRKSDALFEQHRPLFEELMDF